MREFKKATRLWFAWDSEKVEQYLEEMSRQGWHVLHADGMLISFLFERGEPKSVRYCMDYQREEKPGYQQIFEDDGWQLMQKSMGWYLWSKEYTGERPSIYTDTESLIQRNRGILTMVAAVLATQMPMIAINMSNLAHVAQSSPSIFVILLAILLLAYSLLVYCIVRLLQSNSRLKRRKL